MPDYLLSILGEGVLQDGGSPYAETNTAFWIVEPWNAVSSLSFFLPVFYWLRRLRGKYREFPFLTYCMPLLFLGGAGSTLFHAFRAHSFFLLLDVLPILVLTASISIYLWIKVLPKWWYIFLLILPYFFLQYSILQVLPAQYALNAAYLLRGLGMFLPACLFLFQTNFRIGEYFFGAVLCFGMALVFRYLDEAFVAMMYMGSHWLWHLMTSLGSFYLAEFLYQTRRHERLK